jgi:hypothetical protein
MPFIIKLFGKVENIPVNTTGKDSTSISSL